MRQMLLLLVELPVHDGSELSLTFEAARDKPAQPRQVPYRILVFEKFHSLMRSRSECIV